MVGVPFSGDSWVHIEYNVAWAEAYLHTKWHVDASSRLATIKMGRKLGVLWPLFGEGSCDPIEHYVDWTKAYLHAKCHLDPYSRLATTDMGQKLGALPPFWGGELGFHLTQCGMVKAFIMRGFILIHPTVWPQYANVTDRTERQTDNGMVA